MEKRKLKESDQQTSKKQKMELCPHAEKCYRRNPHHFKEYCHPHLDDFINKLPKDILQFPQNFTQDKQIYFEQLEVIRSLLHIKLALPGVATKDIPSQSSSSSSSSSSKTNSPKKMVKKTIFVPNISTGGNIALQKEEPSKMNMKDKFDKAQPYSIFFTTVPKAIQTINHSNSISFPDLLCPSLGTLKCSMQINFMIDIMWLNEQYQVYGLGKKPLTVLYGYEFPKMKEYMEMKMPNVKHHMIKMKDPFGVHHSKVGLYAYEDNSLRVVVSTANLYYEDWNHYNQGLWISPACPKMDDSKPDYECSGATGFKTSLINYFNSYNLPILTDWINMVKRADFSAIKVFLVTSVPGKHYPKESDGCHLQRVGTLLSKYCILPAKTTPQTEGPLAWGVIAQSSSIGSLGKNPGDWLRSVLLRSLASHKAGPLPCTSKATLSVVFPTGRNVMYSHFGAEGGGCLPYSKTVNDKQKWLQDYLHEWKADRLGRSRAMPHMKSYCRVSPCMTKLAYFLLTSSNMSKSAWGGNIQRDSGCYVRSNEVGVLFIPSYFDEEYFTIQDDSGEKKLFPFMYDLPLSAYKKDDEPWCN